MRTHHQLTHRTRRVDRARDDTPINETTPFGEPTRIGDDTPHHRPSPHGESTSATDDTPTDEATACGESTGIASPDATPRELADSLHRLARRVDPSR